MLPLQGLLWVFNQFSKSSQTVLHHPQDVPIPSYSQTYYKQTIINSPVTVRLQKIPQHWWQNNGAEGTARNAQSVGQPPQPHKVRRDDVDGRWKGQTRTDAHKDAVADVQVRDGGGPERDHHSHGGKGTANHSHRAVRILDGQNAGQGTQR